MEHKITINKRQIGAGNPPYIIAELSANHNGNLQTALDTISAASVCGADAIKIQTYTADSMTIDCNNPQFKIDGGLWHGYTLHELYREAETPYEWHKPIFEHAQKSGITAFSTPFDETAVDLLEDLNVPAYKIASFEAIDLPLIRYVASTGKPMIISTGMANETEIAEACETARESGCTELALLHCISSYPAPVEQSNIRTVPDIAQRFGVVTGLSDHSLGNIASIAATVLGASIIEKHFILDRNVKGPDSSFSIEPDELQSLCYDCQTAWTSLGNAGYEKKEAEKDNIRFRRSIYFTKTLKAGDTIKHDDIRRIRPGFGLAPKYFDQLPGKTVLQDIPRGTPVSHDLLSSE